MPRNVDPAVAALGNLFVFNVDDLEAVVASNIREREKEAERAELIVEAEARQFEQVLRGLDAGAAVGAFRQELQDIARCEFAKGRKRLGELTPEQERAVEALLISTANKIAHPAIQVMRRSLEETRAGEVRSGREKTLKAGLSLDAPVLVAA